MYSYNAQNTYKKATFYNNITVCQILITGCILASRPNVAQDEITQAL